MKNKKISIHTILAAIAPAIALLLIASLITATVFLANQGKPETKGIIGRGDNGEAAGVISDAPFQYDIPTRNTFIFDFEKFLSVVFGKDILKAINATGVSISQYWATAFIDAFRRARVPSEKFIAFGDYLEKISKDFSGKFDNPNNASAIFLIYAILLQDEEKDTDLFYQMLSKIEWDTLYKELIKETGLTPEEAGRVLYQLALVVSEGTDRQLGSELGERSFVILFARTLVAVEEISMLTSGSTLASARMVAEMLYELGHEYRNIIDTFGIENLNNLFGSVYLDEIIKETDSSNNVISALTASAELFGFGIAFLSEMLTVLDNNVAYSYHQYINSDGDEADNAFALSTLYLVEAAQKGLDYACNVTGLSMIDLGGKIASINANLTLVEDPDLNYNETFNKELFEILTVYNAFSSIADAADEAKSSVGYEAYLANPANVEAILQHAKTVTDYAPDIQKGVQMSTTLIALSYLSYLIAPGS